VADLGRWAQKEMILAFADDSTVQIYDTVEQANGYCETIDVENQEYTFLDEHGYLLRPTLKPRVKKRLFGIIPTVGSGGFTMQKTEERREDLVRKLESGEISIQRSPAKILTLDDLRSAAPFLFRR
jgi:hypothetical protein